MPKEFGGSQHKQKREVAEENEKPSDIVSIENSLIAYIGRSLISFHFFLS